MARTRTSTRWLAVALGTLALTGARRCACGPSADPLRGSWSAGLDRDDYLERIDFGADGRGAFVQGDHQVVRVDARFAWRARGDDEVELRFGHAPDAPRRTRFAIERGTFCFDAPDRGGVCCEQRVRFDPPPADVGDGEFFRGCAASR